MVFSFCLALQASMAVDDACLGKALIEPVHNIAQVDLTSSDSLTAVLASSVTCPLPSAQTVVDAAASSTANRYSAASKAVDGDINPNRSTGNLWITSPGDQTGAWIEFEFEGEVAIHTIRMFQMGNDRRNSEIRSFTVITDLGEQAVATVPAGTGWRDVRLAESIIGSRIRLIVDRAFDYGEGRVSLKEIEFLGCEERL